MEWWWAWAHRRRRRRTSERTSLSALRRSDSPLSPACSPPSLIAPLACILSPSHLSLAVCTLSLSLLLLARPRCPRPCSSVTSIDQRAPALVRSRHRLRCASVLALPVVVSSFFCPLPIPLVLCPSPFIHRCSSVLPSLSLLSDAQARALLTFRVEGLPDRRRPPSSSHTLLCFCFRLRRTRPPAHSPARSRSERAGHDERSEETDWDARHSAGHRLTHACTAPHFTPIAFASLRIRAVPHSRSITGHCHR
jgi:hypothetical protein